MKRLNISLTTKGSLNKAIEYLEQYKKELVQKSELFVSRLIDLGIEAGQLNSGQYGNYIVFRKELNLKNDGCEGLLIATDREKIIRQWYRGGQIVSAEISPLLMSEFGSGWLAQVLFPSVDGKVGQGTFPDQIHAFDEDGWWWTTPDGVTHHSKGETPTHPMHNAYIVMYSQIDKVAREVFK